MGTKYSTNTVSGYNATPPSDDGSATEANKVKWSTIKTKLSDPVNTLAAAVNTDLVTHFDKGPVAYTSNQTLGATNYNQFIQVSGASVTLTLSDANTLGAGWFCDIVNTDQSNNVTLGRATASDMINQVSANDTIYPQQGLRVFVNAAANGFQTMADVSREANNTITGTNTFSGTNSFNHTTANSAPITIQATEDSATVGPLLNLVRSSASPAASDVLAKIRWVGKDSGSTDTFYGGLRTDIVDPTDASEDGVLIFDTVIAGSAADRLKIGNGIYTPSATGGDQGLDTINASALYDDGVAVLTTAGATYPLLRDVTATSTSNSTTETTVFTDTVPANSLSTNRMLRITLIGAAADTNTGASTLTLRVKYGGTTALTMTLTHASSSASKALNMVAFISADNATNSQQAIGRAFMSAAQSDGASIDIEDEVVSQHRTVAVDSTSAQTLAITVQMGTAHASVSNVVDVTHVELV